MNAFSRSWLITKMSFDVINKDRELLWFALLSFLFSSVFSIAMIVPTVVAALLERGFETGSLELLQYVIIFLTYFGLAFIATFFNVCVVYTAKVRFEGGNATFGESIRFAMSRIGLIAQWSLLSASVGLLLRLIQNFAARFGKIGQIVVNIIVGLIGLAWSIVTIFVVPVLVYEGLGPVDAVKRSVDVIKKTWGESLIRSIGMGFVQVLVFLAVMVVVAGLTFILVQMFEEIGLIVGIGIGVLLFLLIGLVFSVAASIFNTALYIYATDAKIVGGFNEEVVKNAFRRR